MEMNLGGCKHQEFLECLYNHQSICEALVYKGTFIAKRLFFEKAQRIIALRSHSPLSPEESARIALTSLNHSLYCYILIHLNASPSFCCYQNRANFHPMPGNEELLQSGEAIIDSYSQFLSSSDAQHQSIESVCVYIKAHLHETLNIRQICEQTYMSKSSLCTAFKQRMGVTFCEYVRQQRLTKAQGMLISTTQSMDEIAEQCGFSSSTYFSTVFKQAFGITPSSYRKAKSKAHHAVTEK